MYRQVRLQVTVRVLHEPKFSTNSFAPSRLIEETITASGTPVRHNGDA